MGVTKRAIAGTSVDEPERSLDRVVKQPALVERLKAGEQTALAELYERESVALLGHLRAMTGDEQLAEDLLQEVFVRVWTHVGRFRAESSLTTWVHGIAFNLARSYRVKRARRHALRLRRAAEDPDEAAPTPEDALREGQARLRLYEAMESLPDAQREAFVLRVLEQRPLAECERLLGVPETTVSYRARQAEKVVRSNIEGEEQ